MQTSITHILGKTGSRISAVFVMLIFITFVGLLTNITIARYFGQENFGIYSYFFSITNIIYIFASFGLANAVAKLTKKELGKRLVKKIILLVVLASLAISAIAYQIGNMLKLNPEISLFFWLMFLYSALVCIFNILGGAVRRLEKYEVASFFSLCNRLLLLMLIALAVFLRSFLIVLLAMPTVIIFLLPFEAKLAKLSSGGFSLLNVLKKSTPFFLALVGMHSIYHIDKISINYVLDFIRLGYYTGISNFVNVLRVGAFVVPFVMITASARRKYNLVRSLKKMLTLLLPFGILIGISAPRLVPLLFGKEFANINHTLVWLMVVSAILFVIYSLVNSIFLGQTGETKFKNIVLGLDAMLSTALNFVLNLFLILRVGLVGAPISTSLVLILKIGLNYFGANRLLRSIESA